MIRSMLMDGLVLCGIVLTLYGLSNDPGPRNWVAVGIASFVLGVIGGRRAS